MYSVSVKNDRGAVLQLTNNPDYTIFKIEGLNPPPATINTSVNTTTDGVKINSARLDSRNLVMYIKPERNIEVNRINLYKYFPSKKTVTVYFKNSSRNVFISGVVETLETDHFENPQIAQVSIVCPDPYFKDVNELNAEIGKSHSLFQFPFAMPADGVEVASYVIDERKIIVNPSDIETGVTIKLFATSTVVNPTVYDVLNNKQMSVNVTLNAYDSLVIESNLTNKKITLIKDGQSSNALGHMRPGSKWFTLSAGDNVFTYECDSGGEHLMVSFTASALYSGV